MGELSFVTEGDDMDSFIGWIGGKRLLRREVVARFPEDFNKYVEVFGGAGSALSLRESRFLRNRPASAGAGWVMFFKEKHADTEVFNDINTHREDTRANAKRLTFAEGEMC